MKIGRRDLIRGAALLGPASAIANLTFTSSILPAHAARVSDLFPQRPPVGGENMGRVAFRIDGWECNDEIAIDRSRIPTRDSAHLTLLDHEVWIGINQSWRATWR